MRTLLSTVRSGGNAGKPARTWRVPFGLVFLTAFAVGFAGFGLTGCEDSMAPAGGLGTGGDGASVTGLGGSCGQTPQQVDAPVTLLGADAFAVEARSLDRGWNYGYVLVGGLGDHVFVCGCGGGQLAGGCGVEDLVDAHGLLVPPAAAATLRCGRDLAPWGASERDFYFTSWHYDGHLWSSVSALDEVALVWAATGTSSDNFWLSNNHRVSHTEGGKVALVPELTGAVGLVGIQAAGKGELWAVDGRTSPLDMKGELVHFAAGAWERTGFAEVTSLSASSETNVWAVDATSIYHFDGSCWTRYLDPLVGAGRAPMPLREVWTSGPWDTWVTADDNILRHFNGEAWELMPLGDDAGLMLGRPWGTPTGLWVVRRHDVIPVATNGETFAFRVSRPSLPAGDRAVAGAR